MSVLVPTAAPAPESHRRLFKANSALNWTSPALITRSGDASAPDAGQNRDRSGEPVGTLISDLDYRQARTALAALLQTREAGTFRANATLQADLGAGSIQGLGAQALQTYTGPAEDRPSVWKARRISTILGVRRTLPSARDHFDLALASSSSHTIRDIRGLLDLHVRKTGPLAPMSNRRIASGWGSTLAGLSGNLALDKVHFVLLGKGAVFSTWWSKRTAQLYPSVAVRELRGQSGNGSFNGNMSLSRVAPGQVKGALELDMKDLPIMADFQTRGFLSLKVRATGTGQHGRIDIPEITLSNGHVIIPAQLSKRVQTMDPHADFEFAGAPPKPPPPPPSANPWVVTIDKITTIPDDLKVEGKGAARHHAHAGRAPEPRLKPIRGDPRQPRAGHRQDQGIIHGVLSLLRYRSRSTPAR